MKTVLIALLLFQSLPAETLLFSAKFEGVWNIYEAGIDNLTPREITGNDEGDAMGRRPVSSPDGSKIAYTAPDGEMVPIFILDTTTGQTKRLQTGSGTCFVGGWSPDGGSIVYTRIPSGTRKSFNPSDSDIFVYDLRSDTEKILVETPFQESGPCFSPDGKHISFSRILSRNNRRSIPKGVDQDFEIYVLDLQTKIEERITDDAHHNWAPVWLPNSNSLIFSSDRVSERSYGQLFLLNLDDYSVSQLTDVDGSASYPSISSDGKLVAYHFFRRSEDPENPYNYTSKIHVLDLSDNTIFREITFGDYCRSPNFRKKPNSNRSEVSTAFAPASLTP